MQTKTMKKLLLTLTAVATLATGTALPVSAQHCTVSKGDSMWKIADRYNVLFKDVLELNKHHINPNLIHPEDKVHLPDGSTGESTNEAQEGHEEPSVSTGAEQSTQAQEVLNLVNQER